jgi:hypothetical protein
MGDHRTRNAAIARAAKLGTAPITIRVPALHRCALQLIADNRRVALNTVMNDAIVNYFQTLGKKEPDHE